MNWRGLLGTALSIAAAVTSSGQPAGVVKVRVIYKSSSVKRQLKNVPQAERDAASEIVRQIGESGEMSFVTWMPDHARVEAAALLTITLFDTPPVVPELPADHFLSYSGEILAPEGKNVRPLLADYGKGVKVFTKSEERKKFGRPKDLAEALAVVVRKQLFDGSVRFPQTFLYQVPLSRAKPTLEDEGTVLVELPWDELGAKPDSILKIDIAAKPPAKRGEQKGDIMLEELRGCPAPYCAKSSVRGKAKFNCPGIGSAPPEKWSTVVEAARKGITSHVVYMEKFIPSYVAVKKSIVQDDFEGGN
jgi:hypothetical protein